MTVVLRLAVRIGGEGHHHRLALLALILLDVFAEERLAPHSPLQRRLDNVVLTSHLGWPAGLTCGTMAQAVVAIIEACLDGNYARAVNPEALQHR